MEIQIKKVKQASIILGILKSCIALVLISYAGKEQLELW